MNPYDRPISAFASVRGSDADQPPAVGKTKDIDPRIVEALVNMARGEVY
jgi:hypothetical protein